MAKNINNYYTVTKEIRGNKYTAQFSGLSTSTRMNRMTKIDGTDNTSMEKLAEYIFEYAIVEPKLSIEDFGKEKKGETQTKLIDGVEYTAKFDGLLTALRAVDESYDDEGEGTDIDKLAAYLFEHIIVSPKKLTVDDFDNMNTFRKVIRFAQDAMRGGEAWEEFKEILTFGRKTIDGDFREQRDKGTVRESSKG